MNKIKIVECNCIFFSEKKKIYQKPCQLIISVLIFFAIIFVNSVKYYEGLFLTRDGSCDILNRTIRSFFPLQF